MADTTESQSADLTGRIIGGVVAISMVLIGLAAFRYVINIKGIADTFGPLLASSDKATVESARANLQALTTASVAIFGAFTTLVGTAITAFFGISAATGATKSAIGVASQAAKQEGLAQQAAQTLTNQNQSLTAKLTFAKSAIAAGIDDPSKHAAVLHTLQAELT